MKKKQEPQPSGATEIETPEIPMTYAYNSCGVEKNLRQIRILKDAGLLTQEDYDRRREAILNRS